MFSKLLLLIACFTLGICVPEKQYCPLTWVEVTLGEFPKNGVPTSIFTENVYLARFQNSNVWYGGYANKNQTEGFLGYFASTGSGSISSESYQVLTNPSDCKLNWNDTWSVFSVRLVEGSANYIGRGSFNESEKILSGLVSNNALIIPLEGSKTKVIEDFQYLESYSEGLRMTVTKFEMVGDGPVPEMELVGIDEVHNRSPVIAKQILVHRTNVQEYRTFTTSKSWGKTVGVSISVDYEITEGISVGAEIGYEFKDGHEESTEIHQETEKEISITREITIPPYTSIQACSWMTLVDDFNMTYKSEFKYTAPGLTARKINEILKEDDIVNGIENSKYNYVTVSVEGTFGGKIAANTKMLVMPYDQDGNGGCTTMAKLVQKLKRAKKARNTEEFKVIASKIHSLMKNAVMSF